MLDEMVGPEGAVQLFAYEHDQAVWIGVRSEISGLEGALGLHTGSDDHYVEATTQIHDNWAVLWGAIAPEIHSVAIRNEQGEIFPAEIVELPPTFNEPYRAAWGIAERGVDCKMIGYDSGGQVVEPAAIRPRTAGSLTVEDRLARIREMADMALRYHATAYERSSDPQERQLHRNNMLQRADVLALVEEDAVDARSMMSWRSSIIARYLESVTTDPWVPGVCSFCGGGPPVAWFEGPDYKTSVASPDEVSSDEAWLACSICAQLVEADDRDGLVRRGVERLHLATVSEASITMVAAQLDQHFWGPRNS